jgi:hypothetical protein
VVPFDEFGLVESQVDGPGRGVDSRAGRHA